MSLLLREAESLEFMKKLDMNENIDAIEETKPTEKAEKWK